MTSSTTTTTYTVLSTHGDVLDRGCDAAEAAHIILTDDGRDYEIRADHDSTRRLTGFAAACYEQNTTDELRAAFDAAADQYDCAEWGLTPDEWCAAIREAYAAMTEITGWTLWTRHLAAGNAWTPTVIYSAEIDRAAAEAEIWEKVLAADWPRHPTAISDAAFVDYLENL